MGLSRFAIAAAGAALGMSSAAHAVPATTNADGKALILVPLTLTKIDDLNFGTVVPSAVSGTVTIDAATGARTIAGGVTGVASDAGNRARFGGAGSAGQLVLFSLTPPATVADGLGNTIPITLQLEATSATIDATKAFYLGVGGELSVGANQAEGLYSADFTVTADYQ